MLVVVEFVAFFVLGFSSVPVAVLKVPGEVLFSLLPVGLVLFLLLKMVLITPFTSSRAPSALQSLSDLLITRFACLVTLHPDMVIVDQNFDVL